MIDSIAFHFPENELTNEELAKVYKDWNPQKIYDKTGIRKRFVAAPDECASDLAFKAAEKLLWEKDRSQIDFLIVCTQTPDYFLPSTACLLQDRLKLGSECGTVDINVGCCGFIHGLAIGSSLLSTGIARQILLLNADTYSHFIRPLDRGTRTIFGDGACATLLTRDSPHRLHSFIFGTDGSAAENIMVSGGGFRDRRRLAGSGLEASQNKTGDMWLVMNGPEVFNFVLRVIPNLIRQILVRANLDIGEIDYFVFHQGSALMLESLRQKLKLPAEKFSVCLENCGNTVSATIPIALECARIAGSLRNRMKIILAGFGVGLSWGGCILEWNETGAASQAALPRSL